jgi:hypothetical protein
LAGKELLSGEEYPEINIQTESDNFISTQKIRDASGTNLDP